MAEEPLVLLYDGVCGLCNGVVRWILRRDRAGRFRFAPLQEELARTLLRRHGLDPDDLDSVVLVRDRGLPTERLERRARAILGVAREVGGMGRLGVLVAWLPTPLLDLAYRCVARVRYRLFGRHDACPLPAPEHRAKFL